MTHVSTVPDAQLLKAQDICRPQLRTKFLIWTVCKPLPFLQTSDRNAMHPAGASSDADDKELATYAEIGKLPCGKGQFCSKDVSFDSRYGTCIATSFPLSRLLRAVITRRSTKRDWLTCTYSGQGRSSCKRRSLQHYAWREVSYHIFYKSLGD